MLYISSVLDNKYGISDTDDNTTEFVSLTELYDVLDSGLYVGGCSFSRGYLLTEIDGVYHKKPSMARDIIFVDTDEFGRERRWCGLTYNCVDLSHYYMVSEYGDIKSVVTGHMRRFVILKKGYLVCSISCGSRDRKLTVRVHRAVAEAFISNPTGKPEVNHADGDKTNNEVSNLEWVDSDENMEHAVKMWLREPAKLTEDMVAWAYSMYEPRHLDYGLRGLARQLGVHHTALRRRLTVYHKSLMLKSGTGGSCYEF